MREDLIERLRREADLIHDNGITRKLPRHRVAALIREAAAALEAAREDAERWRHARKLLTIDDIEGAQGAYESFGRLVSEYECKRADDAIDQARGKVGGEVEGG